MKWRRRRRRKLCSVFCDLLIPAPGIVRKLETRKFEWSGNVAQTK
jgi:hypothetical protein